VTGPRHDGGRPTGQRGGGRISAIGVDGRWPPALGSSRVDDGTTAAGGGMTLGGTARLYELRLHAVGDARTRQALAAALTPRVPADAAAQLDRGLATTGFSARLRLGDAEAAALLREVYATGVAPAAVVLRPVGIARAAASPPAFAAFERRGGRFVPTWNWAAFLFGPLWYVRRGLYGKGIVLGVLSFLPIGTLVTTLLCSVLVLVYCGVAGNWDRYLLETRGTQWW